MIVALLKSAFDALWKKMNDASMPVKPVVYEPVAPLEAPAAAEVVPVKDPNNRYAKLWAQATVRPAKVAEFTDICRRILANRARYEAIEQKCGVPWWAVAVIHMRESDFDWSTYLGNGDPLNRRTIHVPRGRGPFATFEDGAADALSLDGLSLNRDWSLENTLYSLEKFNGLGYQVRGIVSPYLWAGTTVYSRGKFIADGEFSSTTVDSQPGCAGVLKLLFPMIAQTPQPVPPKPVPHPDHPIAVDFGQRVKRAMLAKYPQAWFPDQNVVSVEGVDPDGSPNANRPNAFDDVKMVLDGDGKIIGGPYEATTHPGYYWTQHPMAEGGAFIIALGPQACWTPGEYHGLEVWRQAEDSSIYGHRDPDCTYKRQGPPVKHGDIGVHHHHGYNLPKSNISNAAAGCQVIRLNDKQEEFMALTKKCPRYLADPDGYRLMATVLEAKDVI